ncbi:MAG: protein-L-isoaspartate(D-aspartate) O-methyltransferase [Candidatus Omnitrophica bacterium]|nr:protein-L-isoaspartate(D-aspartate) O-methyltransferase [Candidatus Omnitrophota bacterium]
MQEADVQDFARQRQQMVDEQVLKQGILDERVLGSLRKVERHLFVPGDVLADAYGDFPLPIGEGQTVSQPYIVALMTELLKLRGSEKVLEIGTGCGYQTAVLSELAAEVFSLERLGNLAELAAARLKKLGYHNVHVKCGDGFAGWPAEAPFDAIIVTCAPEAVPAALEEQLAEGGRLVVPTGVEWQELLLVRKNAGRSQVESVAAVRFVPMVRGCRDGETGRDR